MRMEGDLSSAISLSRILLLQPFGLPVLLNAKRGNSCRLIARKTDTALQHALLQDYAQMKLKPNLVAPLEGPGAVADIKGVRALPHAAAGAKLVADAVAGLRHSWRRALPVCGLPQHHLRSQAPVCEHSVDSWCQSASTFTAGLRHNRGCALPICGLLEHDLRSQAPVSQHSLDSSRHGHCQGCANLWGVCTVLLWPWSRIACPTQARVSQHTL